MIISSHEKKKYYRYSHIYMSTHLGKNRWHNYMFIQRWKSLFTFSNIILYDTFLEHLMYFFLYGIITRDGTIIHCEEFYQPEEKNKNKNTKVVVMFFMSSAHYLPIRVETFETVKHCSIEELVVKSKRHVIYKNEYLQLQE